MLSLLSARGVYTRTMGKRAKKESTVPEEADEFKVVKSKKNKKPMKIEEDVSVNEHNDLIENNINNAKKSKHKDKAIKKVEEIKLLNENEHINIKKESTVPEEADEARVIKGKEKKRSMKIKEDISVNEHNDLIENNSKAKKSKHKEKTTNNDKETEEIELSNENEHKSTEKEFIDDIPQESTQELSSSTNKGKKKKKKNKHSEDDIELVKDEDINAFCEELDEEDNKQYEDWVKLIEAKMHGKKSN